MTGLNHPALHLRHANKLISRGKLEGDLLQAVLSLYMHAYYRPLSQDQCCPTVAGNTVSDR